MNKDAEKAMCTLFCTIFRKKSGTLVQSLKNGLDMRFFEQNKTYVPKKRTTSKNKSGTLFNFQSTIKWTV